MRALLLQSSLKKACVGISEGVLYVNRSLTEHSPFLSSTLAHLFLVNHNYLKFLEMLTMWEGKKPHVLFLSPSLFVCEGRKLKATAVTCLKTKQINKKIKYFLKNLNCIM